MQRSGTRHAHCPSLLQGGRLPELRADLAMIDIERILCPIDLTENSTSALRYAAALAKAYNAKLFTCYCTAEPAAARRIVDLETSRRIEKLIEDSLDLYIGTSAMRLPPWESIVARGDVPAEAITHEAVSRSVDIIVMSSRRRPLRAAVLGSTAEAVYRTAPCPVLVTHPDQREWVEVESGKVHLKRIMVAHDFADYSELALQYALSLAQQYQAELHLIHVLPAPILNEPELKWTGNADGAYHKAARKLHAAVSGEAYLWCQVKTIVRWGKPYQEILAYAKEAEIDLIVMGAHGAGFSKQALFGSNVDRVLRQAPCPVLVTRPLRPSMPVFD
jgi:nucleotide-binding universal stress UspA family protein